MRTKLIALPLKNMLENLAFSASCAEGGCIGLTGNLEVEDHEQRVFSFGVRSTNGKIVAIRFLASEDRKAVRCQAVVSDSAGSILHIASGTTGYADRLWASACSVQNPVRYIPKILAELKVNLSR